MAIRFDNIEAQSLLNSQGELTITLTNDQGISVPGNVAMASGNATGKFAVKSAGVHASYDFYNDGTSYFNGGVTVDAAFAQTGGGASTFSGTLSASNLSGTNTGDQDLSSYLTTVAFSDLTGKPTTLSGYGIIDGVSLGLENVFTGDNEFEGDLLRTNQRISNNQEYPLGHYTPGETVFELDPTWSDRELRQYFANDNVSWDSVANAPGGYAVYINGSVSVGGAYNSGFPYIPIDQDGIYYMEVWIKNAGTAQGHYMGSIDYEADFSAPASGSGNPGSYGYWVMSNYTGAAEWTKKSGYITGHHNNNTGAFETDATYWTPQALFNYSAGTGTRACWISGWKVIRVDHVGDRTFQDDVVVKGKLEVHTLDTNSSSTTALVMNGNEVEKRTLGSNAFNSTSFLTSVDFTDIGGTASSTGGATRTNYNLGFKPPASSYAGFRFYGTDGQNAGYFLVRGTSDNDVYAAEGITLVGDQGWLTLAHRYSSNKGIRFMTGDSSVSTRMSIGSDGNVTVNNNLTVGVDLAVNGNIKDNDYKHAGSDLWLTKKYIRSVGLSGGEIANAWVHLSRVAIASSYGKLTVKFTIHGYDDVSSGTEVIDAIYENGNSAQENHGCQWYSLDNNANLFKAVRSIRSGSSGTDNTYDIYVQMAGDWRDTFTVVAEYWRTGTNQSITFQTSTASATEPSAGSDDIENTERRWYTQNTYMYLGGSNRVYTTGDFATSDFTYSAGTLLDLSSNTFNVDLTELTNNTASFAPTQDHFVILDNGVQGKKLASSIFGSAAYEASSAFAAASHNHAGTYALEYENLAQASGAEHDMHQWRKVHASYSNNSGNLDYLVIQTEVPQDNYSMGGFTLVYQDNYNTSGEGGEIKIYGYWNPEVNGGFQAFRYECSNPYHTPTIEVCRNSSSGNTAFFISGEGGDYTQLIAKDLWFGYTASNATSQWGNGWVISEAADKNGYTNFDTLNRNDFAAITTDGTTPSLTGGVSAAEVRTLIGAQVAGSYLTAHPSITEAADVDNSGGTVIQDLTFDDNGHVTATGSVNLDNIYTSTDGTENDYRFGLNLSSFSGTRWYKVATVNVGSGGLRIRGMMTNHVESFGSNMIDLAIQGREGNNNNEIEVTGHVHVLHENAGIAIYSGEKPGSYTHWDVYVVATQYTQCQLDLTAVSGSFDTSKNYVTTEPTGTLELETYQLAEGNYVIRDSAAKRIFDSGINLAGGLSYTPSTNTLTQTDNNTTYSAGTGLTLTNTTFSVTSGTYAPSSHNHNSIYYTEDEIRLALARTNGWEADYGSTTSSNIKWNLTEEALELKNDTDTSIGAVYKAVWMEAGETKRWTVMIRGSQTTTDGMYVRLYQHDGNLPDGKTHVTHTAAGTFTQEDDRGDTGWYENGAISDSWTNFEREYKAPAAGYVSLVVLNWTGNGTESLFIKNPDIQTVYATVEAGSIGISELAVSDGSDGQVLTTNGSGTLSFATVSSGSADTNYYLDGITRTDNTNTLVFSVNGATNQSYTFGANAFNSTTIPAAEQYTAHEDTSTLNGTYGSTANGTKIDEITVDANGHITAITTGATGNMTGFFVEDGDGTEVQINNANEWKFVEGTGISINWTDTSAGSDTDPYDLTIACTIDSPGEVGLANLSSSGNALAGTFTATGDLIAYSDARVKENVETIPNALEKVTALRGVNFNKIGEEKRSTGVIAQEVAEVIPEVVHESEDGMLGVAYGNITGLLIEAIKEQQKQIDELKAKLDGSTK
jgi:hypothetical protein